MRSQVTTSEAVASPPAISAAAAESARAEVAQACDTVGPVTNGAPIIVITQGAPQKLFSCGTVMPSTA